MTKKHADSPKKSQPFVLQNITTWVAIAALTLSVAGFIRAWYLDARRLRAWVTTDTVRMAEPVEPGKPAKVIVTIKNTGAAPAQQLTGCLVIDSFPGITKADQLPDCDKNPNGSIGIPSTSVLGIGVPKEFHHETKALTVGDVSALTGGQRLFVWGKILYSDPYGTQGGAEFCFVWHPGTLQLDDCDGHRNRVW